MNKKHSYFQLFSNFKKIITLTFISKKNNKIDLYCLMKTFVIKKITHKNYINIIIFDFN